jgi:anaphase-promoting complex subunit 8
MIEHADAEAQFTKILAIDPERIDNIDVYSNILYLTNNKLKLSSLAHDFLALDKDRPEVCCVVGASATLLTALLASHSGTCRKGNHYSIRGEHEKAIKYFRRATHLDRTYLAAWTLLGHEYVELKNSHAAIEAYRRAVGEFHSAHHLEYF